MGKHRYLWSTIAALTYGGLAAFFSNAIGYLEAQPANLGGVLGWASILSAFVIGGWSWDRFVERRDSNTVLDAGVSGLVTGILSHPLMWLIAAIWSLTQSVPLSGWWMLSLLSLLFFGLATAFLGTIGGVLLGTIRVLVGTIE